MTILTTDLATRERRPLLWWLSAPALASSPRPEVASPRPQSSHVRIVEFYDWEQKRWL